MVPQSPAAPAAQQTPELKQKRLQPTVCHGHTRPIVDVEFSSLTPDGYFMASASKDGQPMLRHGENGDWYGTFIGHKGCVWSCGLNKTALLCATGSADFTARVWDACSGSQLHEFQHQHVVRTTAFSSGSKLATGGHGKEIRVYDLERPEETPVTYAKQPDNIRCLQWLAGDNILMCSLADKKGIVVFDVRTQQQVHFMETDAPVSSIELSFDGRHLTTAEGKCVRIWDAPSMRQVKSHTMEYANAESASFCPSRGVFAAGGGDMWVRLFSNETGEELECNKGHHGPVRAVRFAPTYDSYASGSEDGTIRIWPVTSSGSPMPGGPLPGTPGGPGPSTIMG
mmetsp:Transcript_8839/g.15310  ORF Transcript_8839/g.15310 Transcript_8839/m.15310 type:complete len:340 (-) Transcript_8839:554-1573(-)|eukprot:CAMPEP_0119101672 /NCGR_PEP_ID=MMETSP1180-20130426/661_1 /TAXON_ID=3052 ORGANISM="Chlamydomonas cf sp, Strain CCMP681" /NCGR_SAMPLE_ID=MMETSP1180 /ASSEMBLY_ACC=CAM_ASM_000741 /LENGTH=339 /DNA_ID=CAMNT_0007085827 /DNA_START=231 /DNA_END=1250 /DNA_ORIENTATION=+